MIYSSAILSAVTATYGRFRCHRSDDVVGSCVNCQSFDFGQRSVERIDIALDLLADVLYALFVVEQADRLRKWVVNDVVRASYVRRVMSARTCNNTTFYRSHFAQTS
jgi:hypothetical protein